MHNPWEELIPFYIAGTLSKTEAARLESHLSACADCNRSLEEWRAIAGVVRDEAASQLRDLPPLSSHVLQLAAQQAQSRRYQQSALNLTTAPLRPATRSRGTFITLVAAVFTLIVFGGLVLFMLRGAQPQRGTQGAVLLPSATATLNPTATPVPSDIPSPTEVGSPTPQPQIIIIEPSNTPTHIPTPLPPTRTRIPATRRPATAVPPPTETPAEIVASAQAQSLTNPSVCTLHVAILNGVVNLYAAPDTSSAVVKTVSSDDTFTALGKSDTGWYRAQYPPQSDQSVGWVPQASVYLSGSCDTLPLIPLATSTPTATVIPFLPTLTSAAATVTSGTWSQTSTIVSTTCAETVGATTTTSGTLILNGDSLAVSYAAAGTPFTLTRTGTELFVGGYTTPNSSISVSLTFTTPTSYVGNAVTAQSDGCTSQSAWSGTYAGS